MLCLWNNYGYNNFSIILFDFYYFIKQVEEQDRIKAFLQLILKQLPTLEEIMTENEVSILIRELVEKGFKFDIDFQFTES